MATERNEKRAQMSSCAVCRGDKNISIVASHTCKFIYAIENPAEILEFMCPGLSTEQVGSKAVTTKAPKST
jgi:hypothetical protein